MHQLYYHWYFKVALLLYSDSCKTYIYRTATYISKRCNKCNHSISISLVKLLPPTLYFQKILIYYHHCNMLDQSCATKWISSDIFQVLQLIYNIFHTYLSNIYTVLLWHIQSSTANRFKVLRGLLLIYSLHYYWCFHITATIMLQWFSSNVLSDIFLVRLLIYALYCRW